MASLDPGKPARLSRGLERQLDATVRRILDQQRAATNERATKTTIIVPRMDMTRRP